MKDLQECHRCRLPQGEVAAAGSLLILGFDVKVAPGQEMSDFDNQELLLIRRILPTAPIRFEGTGFVFLKKLYNYNT